jgi:hypothetical protein
MIPAGQWRLDDVRAHQAKRISNDRKEMNLAERIRLVTRRYSPELPEPRMVCSLVYDRTLEDGRHEYKCSQCGDTQIVDQLLDATETRVCRGTDA